MKINCNHNKILLIIILIVFFTLVKATTLVNNWLSPSVSYKNLENMLQARDWDSADLETNRLLLKLSKRNFLQLYYLFPQIYDFNNISCSDLATIDQLWSSYSNKKFGLGIQSTIWHNAMQDINWHNYMRGTVYKDSQIANLIFQDILSLRQELPNNYSNSNIGQLPSQDWIFQGTQDGVDPLLTAKDFYSRLRDCKI